MECSVQKMVKVFCQHVTTDIKGYTVFRTDTHAADDMKRRSKGSGV